MHKMKTSFTLFCLLMITYISAFDLTHEEWHIFKGIYGKSYKNPLEEQFRKKVYLENKKKIEEHNKAYENGEVSFKMKMNHFGDLLSHEFDAMMNGFKIPSDSEINGEIYVPKGGKLPQTVDWVMKGAVTPVKYQGQCGSCWAFSATGSIEGQHFLKASFLKKLVSLSEQNLMDCSWKYGNNGCEGGNVYNAFTYVIKNNGLDTEASYPYKAVDNHTCNFNSENIGATVKGYVKILKGKEIALQDAVTYIGPISVAIHIDTNLFQFYSEGIIEDQQRINGPLNHAVLVVGYDKIYGQEYWVVKNSWGPTWGERGYFKTPKNKGNQFGIASMAAYPLV